MCKRHSVHTCRIARNWNVSPKSGVAAGGLAQGAMTQIAASPVRGADGEDETLAAGATKCTAGWGMAALGREPVGGVRNGGACYTESVSPDHLLEGAVANRHRLWGRLRDTGGFWGSTRDFKHHWCILLVLSKKCERLIRMPSCHTRGGFFLGR